MLSIVWTDVVQFLIMTIAGIVIVVIGMQMVAPDMIHSFVPAGWDSPFFGWTLDVDWSSRMNLLTERMANEPYSLISIFVMMALLKGIFMSMAGPAPNYDMQKILSCKSPKEAAMMSGSVSVVLLIPRYLMIMGFALLAIYFFKEDHSPPPNHTLRTGRIGRNLISRTTSGFHVNLCIHSQCRTSLYRE
jgi:Na+/proline symporter